MSAYPCIDPQTRRYRSFPCSQCRAVGCVFGKKPRTLAPGQKHCRECDDPFTPGTGGQLYCKDVCRRRAMEKRRSRKQAQERGEKAGDAGFREIADSRDTLEVLAALDAFADMQSEGESWAVEL